MSGLIGIHDHATRPARMPYRPTTAERKLVAYVAQSFGVPMMHLTRRDNRPAIVAPRQMAFWLLYRVAGLSLPEIGDAFGMHHTTVLHGVRRVDAEAPELLARWETNARAVMGAPPRKTRTAEPAPLQATA